MAVADVTQQGHQRLIRYNHPTRTLDWLHDKGGNRVGALKNDLVLHGVDNRLGQFGGVALIERIAIRIGAGQMKTARQQWLIGNAKAVVTIHGSAAKMSAMIAFFQR